MLTQHSPPADCPFDCPCRHPAPPQCPPKAAAGDADDEYVVVDTPEGPARGAAKCVPACPGRTEMVCDEVGTRVRVVCWLALGECEIDIIAR